MSTFDFAKFFDDKAAWSTETFGPGDRYAGVVKHIRKELKEIEAEPWNLEEWVDVALLAMDGARRSAGADGATFVAALEAKQAKNRVRRWPDWRTLKPGEVSEHVREAEEAFPEATKVARQAWESQLRQDEDGHKPLTAADLETLREMRWGPSHVVDGTVEQVVASLLHEIEDLREEISLGAPHALMAERAYDENLEAAFDAGWSAFVGGAPRETAKHVLLTRLGVRSK